MSMITDELLRFIQGKLQAGVSRQEIEKTLVTQGGWSKPDIDEAFRAVSQAQETLSEFRGEEGGTASPAARVESASKRGLPLLPTLAGVGTLAAASVVVYVVFGSALGLRHSAPSDIDGFLADFIEAAQKIEKFEYEVSLTAVQEERDESLEPLTVSDPGYESRLALVERDVVVLEDALNVRDALDRSELSAGSYPASLGGVDLTPDVDTSSFTYGRTDGGSDYELVVQFETIEMLNYIETEEPYEMSEDTKPEVDRDNLTATFSKQDIEYYSTYTGAVLQKNPLVQSLEQLNVMAQLLPSRFASDVTFSGVVGLEQEAGKIPDTENSLAINADWGDLTFAVDGEAVVKDEEVYVRVNRFPPLFFFDIEPIREKWIELPADEYRETVVSMLKLAGEEDNQALAELPKLLAEAVSEHNPFILKEAPRKEELEDGTEAFGYSLGINGENLGEFYKSLHSKITPLIFEEEELEAMNFELEKQLAFFETEEFLKIVDYLNEHTEFIVWMDQKTGYPVQYSTEIVFVPNPEMMAEESMLFAPAAAPKDTQLRLTSMTKLISINQEVSIEAPENALTYEEATELLFGRAYVASTDESRDRGSDATIMSNLNYMIAEGDMYHHEADSYEGFCASQDGGASFIESVNESAGANAACHDSPGAWAAEATLSDGSFYCVDSTGQTREEQRSTAGDYICG